MLCEVSAWGNLLFTWLFLNIIAGVLIFSLSGALFYIYYVKPTYEMWRWKSNPEYPSAQKVRDEVYQMLKGMFTASFPPALSLYLTTKGYGKGYCGIKPEEGLGWNYTIFQFFFIWIVCDFYEFFYHRLGHQYDYLWSKHKHHHVFYNPSPFAVISDEYFDQLWRALPLLVLPCVMSINIDLIFFEFGLFFYFYGTYLHWGYELNWPDAHHPWINSSFQHYLHHAISIKRETYHTGFFFKFWDKLFGSIYKGECFCAKCDQKKGNRTLEKFQKVVIPDYSPMLTLKFWLNSDSKKVE